MIKIAFNRERPELVFLIDRIKRIKLNDVQGIVEYYSGVLRDTSPVPDATTEADFKVRCAGFEMDWCEVPVDLSGATDLNIQPSKTVTPTLSSQTVAADKDYTGLGKVVVNAAPVQSLVVTPSASSQIFNPPSNLVGYNPVQVNAVPLEQKTITAGTARKQAYPSSGKLGFSMVQVEPVTASIDSNITAANIKAGVTILGVTGTYTGE